MPRRMGWPGGTHPLRETFIEPPVPADLDVRTLDTMPLAVADLLTSDLYLTASPLVFRAALTLWCVAWHQVPAGSLPDDPEALRILCGHALDARTFSKNAATMLHGWCRARNARLYHPVLCRFAAQAARTVGAQRARATRRWRTSAAQHPDTPAHATASRNGDELDAPAYAPACPTGLEGDAPAYASSVGVGVVPDTGTEGISYHPDNTYIPGSQANRDGEEVTEQDEKSTRINGEHLIDPVDKGREGMEGRGEGEGGVTSPDPAPTLDLAGGESGTAARYRTKKGRYLVGGELEAFTRFWAAFRYPHGKAEAADAWREARIQPGELSNVLFGAECEAKARRALTDAGRTPKWAQGWLSGRRWEAYVEMREAQAAASAATPGARKRTPQDWIEAGERLGLPWQPREEFPAYVARIRAHEAQLHGGSTDGGR